MNLAIEPRSTRPGFTLPEVLVVVAIIALLLAFGAGCGSRESVKAAPEADREVSLPGITVWPVRGEMRIDGRICLEAGILEYLAVAKGGKEYESLFTLPCRPSQLQMAMIMAGYQTGELEPGLRGDFAETAGPATSPAVKSGQSAGPSVTAPPGDYWEKRRSEPTQVVIEVEIQQNDGTWQRRPIESLIRDRRTGRSPERLVWAFTGSFFIRDEMTRHESFAADAERSIIAMWYDPTCLLNLAQDVGNPYRAEASGLAVNRAAVPPVETPVRLILRKAPTGKRD